MDRINLSLSGKLYASAIFSTDEEAKEIFNKMVEILIEKQCRIAQPKAVEIKIEPDAIPDQSETTEPVPLPKKRVFFHCQSCNKLSHSFAEISGLTRVVCMHCGQEKFTSDLKPARYKCTKCFQDYKLMVEYGVENIPCKGCGSPIDLVWNDKKYCYENLR